MTTLNKESLTTRLESIFCSHHRYTTDRFKWTCAWVGLKNYKQRKLDIKVVESRIDFLFSIWKNHDEFRPFDTVESSENYLTVKNGFLLRLSTTRPGKITCSWIQDGYILHRRLKVNENGTIHQKSTDTLYSDIHDFCSQFYFTCLAKRINVK
mmetsp:Transcript_4153/g.6077  ORF Transcript_4153/g.6077 Transcript_4153/m.6077 type:complete len:153 (+) Transcript_4153:301-759(+)